MNKETNVALLEIERARRNAQKKAPPLISLEELIESAFRFGGLIKSFIGQPMEVTTKFDSTPVTMINLSISRSFRNLAEKYSGVGFMSEEENGDNLETYEYILYVDPLDGTEAFLRCLGTSSIIATLMRVKNGVGTPEMAVIHNPVTGLSWSAERGKGAWYHRATEKHRQVINETSCPTLIRTNISTWHNTSHKLREVACVVNGNPEFSDLSLSSFGYGGGLIASGFLDATVIGRTSAVEAAAMSLIIGEAGGVSIDLSGDEFENFTLGYWKGKLDFLLPEGALFARNKEIARKLLKVIRDVQ